MSAQRSARIGIALLVLLAVVWGFMSYRNTFQSVSITSKSEFTLKLYPDEDSEDGLDYDKNRVVLSASKQGAYRIKKGIYVYVISRSSPDYQSVTNQLEVADKPVKLSIPEPVYTDSKLAALLKSEGPDIRAAIQAKYPSQMQLYSIGSSKLYKHGEWYGATLVPNDPAAYDTLRIVLKKEGSEWKVVTDPPEIIISKPVYPNIPGDMLTDLNNFQ